MITALTLAALFLSGHAAPLISPQADPKALKVASLGPDVRPLKVFSMGGIAYELGYCAPHRINTYVTCFLPPNASSFTSDFGVPDDLRNLDANIPTYFEVLVDGDLVAGGDRDGILKQGDKPKHIQLDVAGKKSIQVRLHNGAGEGDPTISAGEEPRTSTGAPVSQPKLLAPDDRAQVTGDSVKFRWQPVSGAVAYVISVTSAKFSDKASDQAHRIWSATVTNSNYTLKLDDLPNGQYTWYVLAFGSTEPIGAYSKNQLFKVDR